MNTHQNHQPALDENPAGSSGSALPNEIREGLEALPAILMKSLQELEKGATLSEAIGADESKLEDIYRTAYQLCGEESWEDALPLMLHLVAHSPQDRRFLFAAGMCFQRTHQPLAASMAYGQALTIDPDDAACAFRMGESLASQGELTQASELFRMAAVLAEADPDRFHHLFDVSRARADELNAELAQGDR